MMTGFVISIIILCVLIVIGVVLSVFIKIKYSKKQNTPKTMITTILKHMDLDKKTDFVDLGAGDFRMVFSARSIYKCNSYGVEISPILIFIAKIKRAFLFGTAENPEVKVESLTNTNLKGYDVLYANIDDVLIPDLIENIKRTADDKAFLYTLNTEISNIKPKETFKLNENLTLNKYSISSVKK